jgi:dienelactone hydrolase
MRARSTTRRGADALAAMRWVAKQPGIDARRIVLLGWSNGAQAVLATIDASRPWPAARPRGPRGGVLSGLPARGAAARFPAALAAAADDRRRRRLDARHALRDAAERGAVAAARRALPAGDLSGAYHGFDGTSELHVRRDIAARRTAASPWAAMPWPAWPRWRNSIHGSRVPDP